MTISHYSIADLCGINTDIKGFDSLSIFNYEDVDGDNFRNNWFSWRL